MSDREKVYYMNGGKYTKTEMVKKALYQCTLPSDSDGYETQCADCPYFDPDCSVSVCKQQLCDDAIALLKEQEAKIEQLNRFVNGFSRDAIPVIRCKEQNERIKTLESLRRTEQEGR